LTDIIISDEVMSSDVKDPLEAPLAQCINSEQVSFNLHGGRKKAECV